MIDEIAISIEPTSDNNRRIIRGVLEFVANEPSLSVHKHLAVPYLDWEQAHLWRGAGLITAAETPGALKKIATQTPNVVSVSLHQTPDPEIATVGSDNRAIGRLAAEHLMETGLRSFAFVGRFDWYHNQKRWEGFSETLAGAGHETAKVELGFLGEAKKHLTGGYHNVGSYNLLDLAKAIRSLKTPVGIVAAHDEFGDAVIEVCRQLKLRVPYDVAILGVNNYRLVCESCDPPLSSIPQSAKRIGFEAASLLHQMILGKSISDRLVLIPPESVVTRRSTDFLAIEDGDVVEAVEFIRSRCHDSITTVHVADKVAIGRKTLDKRFHKSLGHPVAEEIRLTRLRKAKFLLSTTEMQIIAVGLSCGYASTSGFVRAFRESTGQTPRQFQRENRS